MMNSPGESLRGLAEHGEFSAGQQAAVVQPGLFFCVSSRGEEQEQIATTSENRPARWTTHRQRGANSHALQGKATHLVHEDNASSGDPVIGGKSVPEETASYHSMTGNRALVAQSAQPHSTTTPIPPQGKVLKEGRFLGIELRNHTLTGMRRSGCRHTSCAPLSPSGSLGEPTSTVGPGNGDAQVTRDEADGGGWYPLYCRHRLQGGHRSGRRRS